jgi:hypothetical protein
MRPRSGALKGTNRQEKATAIVDALQPLAATLSTVTPAARLSFLQASTNRNAASVLHPVDGSLSLIERLHFLFQLRACALLALDRSPEAGDDVLTSLHLARLGRQAPDAKASTRVQVMLARSLQPLWEGLAERRWNESQLASFQSELEAFNLLSDHTNAIGRVVRAYIEIWQKIPDLDPGQHPIVLPVGGYGPPPQAQPRAWWFENCIQLYQAGQHAIEQVDVPGARVRVDTYWTDLNGLQVDGEASQLLQQAAWWGPSPTLVSFAQTAVNQGIIACALERFRLATGAYPDSLDRLVPVYLRSIPYDIMRGQPMIYQALDNERCILRSVGPNGINDQNNKSSDDWLWAYPGATNTPPARPRSGVPR